MEVFIGSLVTDKIAWNLHIIVCLMTANFFSSTQKVHLIGYYYPSNILSASIIFKKFLKISNPDSVYDIVDPLHKWSS